ncbi:hypothetical protein COT60_03225 [Candidatus Pacearchaeota archaeon CG09_land_8_20_14_0_10_30_9]|nr:MAG: hypothetical protein QJ16_C0002G0048 [archaeon GW2011_AR1]NCO17968.1 YhbY family RNA-binding protein [Candidatus Pacearchaeota archaeon]OIO40816.1 MAG: hypothetical protein AUJ61_01230 [Candidatus Pacearchaeota archaeon CG1_02_30_18]PIN71650.1 MAG: hypothetical protein COV77_00685 [Candidatus Pacearchaeota archaeon CG11_big_fil_rev_8_21_14_0_20_30_13]PIO00908.1 MAG: hypothetical protein COT60_03225 [Candidatus Pacearchaeota archaeon CG09_land_8_20_14_0_10_30_9]PJA71668.1 MAG: hypotheti
MAISEIQLGKNGITENFLSTLKTHFQKVRTLKISVLRSARENKGDVKILADKLLEELGEYYTAKVIGFKIVLKKWRKPREEKIFPEI